MEPPERPAWGRWVQGSDTPAPKAAGPPLPRINPTGISLASLLEGPMYKLSLKIVLEDPFGSWYRSLLHAVAVLRLTRARVSSESLPLPWIIIVVLRGVRITGNGLLPCRAKPQNTISGALGV